MPWSASISFEVSNSDPVTQGGIFITREFGSSGDFFGGPSKFHGAVVLFEVRHGSLSVEYRVNKGKRAFENSTIIPHVESSLSQNSFTIALEFGDRDTLDVWAEVGGRRLSVFNGHARVSGQKKWLSVNGCCPTNATELMVVAARLSYPDFLSGALSLPEPDVLVGEFDSMSQLKHREFVLLSRVLVAWRQNRSVDGDLDSVFDGIMEIGRVIGKSSKLNPTLRMIEGVMHNYTDSWKRRSLRMIAEAETLRTGLAGEVTTVSFLVQVFEWNVAAELALMKTSSQNFCKSVTEGIVEIANRMAEMRRPTGPVFIIRLMVFTAIVEIALLGLYAIILNRAKRRG
jgi:hypothetical protein